MAERGIPASRRAIFDQYATDRRTAQLPNFRLEVLPDLSRYSPIKPDDEAVIAFARLSPQGADRRIRDELGLLREKGWEAEWKVHDFDEPGDLKSRLEAHGLHANHVEALMVLEVADALMKSSSSGTVVIEKMSSDAIGEMVELQEQVWGCRIPWLAASTKRMLEQDDGENVLYCARAGKRMVGSGRIEFPRGSSFAQLCGGAVLEEYRGRGIYSRLFQTRLDEVRARGVRFVAVDAAPMSRPILERKGFKFICHTYPMRTCPFDASPVTKGC